jgi:hypothetical protein
MDLVLKEEHGYRYVDEGRGRGAFIVTRLNGCFKQLGAVWLRSLEASTG